MNLRRAIAGTAGALTMLGSLSVPLTANADASGAMVDSASCTRTAIPRNDDGSGPNVDLPFDVNFYGTTYDHLWVNNNGNVTFDGPLATYTPFGLLGTNKAIIAPFFADVDTRATGSDVVRYGYGETTFEGHDAFCVNWSNVGYYANHADKLNSFQLLLVSRPDQGEGAFDIVFNYDKVQWETGDASGGTHGLGGTPARAGFSSGNASGASTATEIPGSGLSGSFLDSSSTGLAHGNLGSNVDGRYIYKVRGNGQIADTYVALGDSFQSGEGAYDYEAGTDIEDAGCHRSANAYPNLLVQRQAVRLDLDFQACSGAVIEDLVANSQKYPEVGPQVAALGNDTRLVTIGIGGNDLDFGGTVAGCITRNAAHIAVGWWSCENAQGDNVTSSLNSLRTGQTHDNLLAAYRLIRAKAPYARIVVVSYPQFFKDGGDAGGLWPYCQTFRGSDQEWMNQSVQTADTYIGEIAHQAGFEYVNMANVLQNHQECSDTPGINGILSSQHHLPPVANESFHPNALGHSLMADRVQAKLVTPVTPTYVIHPYQTIVKKFVVEGHRWYVNVAWPGSDVVTTLVSPSGKRYTRTDPQEAGHGNGPTWEYYDIANPEAGEWTVESYGADVATAGEDVTLTTHEELPTNQAPTAVFASAPNGPSGAFAFDASDSVDTDGTIVRYRWDFGDGTTAEGRQVNHKFSAPGQYLVTLVTTDDDETDGFGADSRVIDTAAAQSSVGFYSATSLTLTNNTEVRSGDVFVNGDFTCGSTVHVDGNVTATGNVRLTNQCTIAGTVAAGGSAHLDSQASIGADLNASGDVSFQATSRIGGTARSGGAFTSIDGTSPADLIAGQRVGGVQEHAATAVIAQPAAPTTAAPAAETEKWKDWLRNTAATNAAPSWSPAYGSSPGCTAASWVLGGSDVNVAASTSIDATAASTGCSSVSLQGLTVHLSGDLTVYADGVQSTNGLRVVSADGQQHTLRVLVPGAVTTCADGHDVTLVGGTSTDEHTRLEVVTPGKVSINGPAQFHGSVASGCSSITGDVHLI